MLPAQHPATQQLTGWKTRLPCLAHLQPVGIALAVAAVVSLSGLSAPLWEVIGSHDYVNRQTRFVEMKQTSLQAQSLNDMRIAAIKQAGPILRLATDLDCPKRIRHQRPRLLLPISAVQRCLKHRMDVRATADLKDIWLANQDTLLDGTTSSRDDSMLCPRGCLNAGTTTSQEIPRLPPLFTICRANHDICALQAILCESTPVLTRNHAERFVGLIDGNCRNSNVSVAAAIAVIEPNGTVTMGLRLLHASQPSSHLSAFFKSLLRMPKISPLTRLPPYSSAVAIAALDALLDAHLPLTVHADENAAVNAVYRHSDSNVDHFVTNQVFPQRVLHAWAGADIAGPFEPWNRTFLYNMGDLAAVPAVAAALMARTGDWSLWNASTMSALIAEDIQGPNQTSNATSRHINKTYHDIIIGGIRLASQGLATRAPCLISVGSVIGWASQRPGTPRLFWGSGAIDGDAETAVYGDDPVNENVWAGVRGPRTRALLIARHALHAPPIGDPALILPKLLQRPRASALYDLAIILHVADVAAFNAHPWSRIAVADPRVLVIDNNVPLRLGLVRLWSARRVVSSSLHGIILAHAYGIPVLPIRLGDALTGGEFKFRDHYHSIGYHSFVRRVPFDELVRQQLTKPDNQAVDALIATVDRYWQPRKPPKTDRMMAAFPYPADTSG